MGWNARREPKQLRSRALVDAIVEAADRVIVQNGLELTANRVAEVAGVSIGSLYRYFSSRESLLNGWTTWLLRQRAAGIRQALEHRTY